LEIHRRHQTSDLAGLPILGQTYEQAKSAVGEWVGDEEGRRPYAQAYTALPLTDELADIKAVALAKDLKIKVWEANDTGTLEFIAEVGTGATNLNLLKTEDHIDLLEADPSRIEAASYQTEHLQERDEESGTVINMPIGTALTLAAQLSELQQLVSQAHNQAREEGATEQEALEVVSNPEVQALAKEVVAVQKEIEKELAQQHEREKVKAVIAQSGRDGVGRASSMGVDPSLYDDIGRTASVASPLDGLRQEPSGPSSSSPQPLTWGQEKLERLDSLRQRCEALIETNPRLAVAGEVLLTSIGYCLQAAVYIKAGVEGAAVGGMVGGPPGAIVGGAVGIMAAYGTGQVMATAVEVGTEKLASTMASQGSTAEQMERFAKTGEWIAKSTGMLLIFAGARKTATKWGHVGKPSERCLSRKLSPLFLSSSLKLSYFFIPSWFVFSIWIQANAFRQ